jgi:hypothetical protein
MNYRLDYTIEKVTKTNSEQSFTKTIKDHKWLLSERLGRDVGLFVAALDYFLNIQQLPTTPKTAN